MIDRALDKLFGTLLFGVYLDELNEFRVVFAGEYAGTLRPVAD
jgi:hypothetical protein